MACVGTLSARTAGLVAPHASLGDRAAPHWTGLRELCCEVAYVGGKGCRIGHQSSLRILYPQEWRAATTNQSRHHFADVHPQTRLMLLGAPSYDNLSFFSRQKTHLAERCWSGRSGLPAMKTRRAADQGAETTAHTLFSLVISGGRHPPTAYASTTTRIWFLAVGSRGSTPPGGRPRRVRPAHP